LHRLYYEAKQFRSGLCFSYESIHACKNDCVLFWKEHADKEECPQCKTSKWSGVKGSGKKIPQKVLWYFPIKPRLQRLFMSKNTAKNMRWHKDKQQHDDNALRHLAVLLCGKNLIKNMIGLLKIPTTCDLV
jgi:hypothetical protein